MNRLKTVATSRGVVAKGLQHTHTIVFTLTRVDWFSTWWKSSTDYKHTASSVMLDNSRAWFPHSI